MRRFFITPANRYGDTVVFSREEEHHISRVLRLLAGTTVELVDGSGAIYPAELEEVHGEGLRARITGEPTAVKPAKIPLSVAQGLLKGKKMDTVIQKCTELGVSRFLPFSSSRCQGKLSTQQALKKHDRYRRIVEAACKQCLRPMYMPVAQPQDYTELVTSKGQSTTTLRLLFWEEEKDCSLHQIPINEDVAAVTVLLGPEGGLSADEVATARLNGWQTVSLGDSILRAETATLSAVSIVQFLLKNI